MVELVKVQRRTKGIWKLWNSCYRRNKCLKVTPLQPGTETTLGNVKSVYPNHKRHEKSKQRLVSTVSLGARTSRRQMKLVGTRFTKKKKEVFCHRLRSSFAEILAKGYCGMCKAYENSR